jgi:exodeoxyribonuclease VII large subunit
VEELNSFGCVDLIIVSRGGGSSEDLWAFNEEAVARAIYNSGIPVISAVGHQINVTLSDLTADVFVETPSAAAKIIVDKKNSLIMQLAGFRHQLDFSLNDIIGELKSRLVALTHMLKSPADRLQEKQQLLDELSSGCIIICVIAWNWPGTQQLVDPKTGFAQPLSVLSRGYSLSMLAPRKRYLKAPRS